MSPVTDNAVNSGSSGDHELSEFLDQDLAELAREDARIRRRASEDPGTAGDEGEAVWAALLTKWLAPYQVVTKGRVLFPDGWASPQVDVVVLRRSYPPRLLDKKLFISSGVLAAFECKNTLTSQAVRTAVQTAAEIKSRVPRRMGSARGELRPPLIYGLLALSHPWRSPGSTPIDNVDEALTSACGEVGEPWCLIDIACVADLTAWSLAHHVEVPGMFGPEQWAARRNLGVPPSGQVLAQYTRWRREEFDNGPDFLNPIAVLIAQLSLWLAWEDPELRAIADYYRLARLLGQGTGIGGSYPLQVLSEDALRSLRGLGGRGAFWDPHRSFQF